MTPLLEVSNLCAGYGGKRVLRNISFQVNQGEFFTIAGPNGAGKSTLLKSIIGLAQVESGQVLWKGTQIERLATEEMVRWGLALVPEGHLCFGEMTVLENLKMGGSTLPNQAMQPALQRVYELFPRLVERASQRAGTLSGGELQMLAIGRALMANPQLLMLDEPSVGLAPRFVQSVLKALVRLKDAGTTILLVEQKARQALAIADRGLVLQLGQVRLHGSAEQLLSGGGLQEVYLGRKAIEK